MTSGLGIFLRPYTGDLHVDHVAKHCISTDEHRPRDLRILLGLKTDFGRLFLRVAIEVLLPMPQVHTM